LVGQSDTIPSNFREAAMNVLALINYAAVLAIAAIILFYVIEQVTAMPVNMRRAVQLLIILVCVLSVVQIALSGTPAPAPHLIPIPSAPSSIIR
jgi:membrane-associated HD superfamily phosphohydrolase